MLRPRIPHRWDVSAIGNGGCHVRRFLLVLLEVATLAEQKALREQLRSATERLNRITTPFAARRMDERARQMMSGRSLR